jgi:uncharacterized SAM-binding protein YcdF (DUF218 family)
MLFHGQWVAGIALMLAGLLALAWVEREPLLRGAADLWIVSDEVSPADAVAVLGGRVDVRPFAAAALYKKGLAKKVLISQVADGPAAEINAIEGHTEANRQVLLRLGVPAAAIETFGGINENTNDEAVALRNWAEHNGASVVIVPAEIFTARRVRWMFQQVLGPKVRVEVPVFEHGEYTAMNWWKSDQGIVTFQNEFIKYIYYRLKY